MKDNQLSVSGSRPNQLSDAPGPDILSDAGVDIFHLMQEWIFSSDAEWIFSSDAGEDIFI